LKFYLLKISNGISFEVANKDFYDVASTVWEGELLRRHYSPKVKEAIGIIEKNVKMVL